MQHLFTNAAKQNDGSKPVKMQMSKKNKDYENRNRITGLPKTENKLYVSVRKRNKNTKWW